MDSLVSIISVYYNREDYVKESINSLLQQTYDNIEIIVIDDGSTDNTYEEIVKIKDPRLKVIKHKNSGFVKSVKKGVSIAKSEFIAIHGSGDYSYPDRIKEQIFF